MHIGSKYQVDVKYVTVDVGNPEARPAAFAKVESLAKEVDLGVLGEWYLLRHC